MHDLLLKQYTADPIIFKSLNYSEIIFPREINTGLAKSRGRTVYAETASVDVDNSASLSNGDNGIDKGPRYRRTFWRDSEILRNRRSGFNNGGSSNSFTASYIITGTLPNSQGHYDGFATSIYGMGRTPMVWGSSCSTQ